MPITENQLGILRHALGLNRRPKAYRNHFVTGKDSSDYNDCIVLVAIGLMAIYKVEEELSELTGGDAVFVVTDAGKAEAMKELS